MVKGSKKSAKKFTFLFKVDVYCFCLLLKCRFDTSQSTYSYLYILNLNFEENCKVWVLLLPAGKTVTYEINLMVKLFIIFK